MYIEDELWERLGKVAGNAKLKRNQLVRNLLTVGVEEMELLQKVGIMQTVMFVQDLKDRMGKRLGGVTPQEA